MENRVIKDDNSMMEHEQTKSDFKDIKTEEEKAKSGSSEFPDIKFEEEELKVEKYTSKEEIKEEEEMDFEEEDFWPEEKVSREGNYLCTISEEIKKKTIPTTRRNLRSRHRACQNSNIVQLEMLLDENSDKLHLDNISSSIAEGESTAMLRQQSTASTQTELNKKCSCFNAIKSDIDYIKTMLSNLTAGYQHLKDSVANINSRIVLNTESVEQDHSKRQVSQTSQKGMLPFTSTPQLESSQMESIKEELSKILSIRTLSLGYQLLTHLQSKKLGKYIKWDDQGKVTLEGVQIPSSNIVHLIAHAVSNRNKKLPDTEGFDVFATYLLNNSNRNYYGPRVKDFKKEFEDKSGNASLYKQKSSWTGAVPKRRKNHIRNRKTLKSDKQFSSQHFLNT